MTVIPTVPGVVGASLELLLGYWIYGVLECFVVNTGINDLPRHSSAPETKLAVPDTVFGETPWVEHESVPNHQYICGKSVCRMCHGHTGHTDWWQTVLNIVQWSGLSHRIC